MVLLCNRVINDIDKLSHKMGDVANDFLMFYTFLHYFKVVEPRRMGGAFQASHQLLTPEFQTGSVNHSAQRFRSTVAWRKLQPEPLLSLSQLLWFAIIMQRTSKYSKEV